MEKEFNLNEELEKIANSIDNAIEEAFKDEDNINFIKAGIDKASNKDKSSFDIQTDNFDIEVKNDSISINSKKVENHSLEDLRQKLINDLYNADYNYDQKEIEIMKILFENNGIKKD